MKREDEIRKKREDIRKIFFSCYDEQNDNIIYSLYLRGILDTFDWILDESDCLCEEGKNAI